MNRFVKSSKPQLTCEGGKRPNPVKISVDTSDSQLSITSELDLNSGVPFRSSSSLSTTTSPVFSIRPISVKYPQLVQLNSDHYEKGFKKDIDNETPKQPLDSNLYEKVVEEEAYNDQGSGQGIGNLFD